MVIYKRKVGLTLIFLLKYTACTWDDVIRSLFCSSCKLTRQRYGTAVVNMHGYVWDVKALTFNKYYVSKSYQCQPTPILSYGAAMCRDGPLSSRVRYLCVGVFVCFWEDRALESDACYCVASIVHINLLWDKIRAKITFWNIRIENYK